MKCVVAVAASEGNELVRDLAPDLSPGLSTNHPRKWHPKVGPRQIVPECCKAGERLNRIRGKIVKYAVKGKSLSSLLVGVPTDFS